MLPHTRNTRVPRGLSDRGFTLVELMITLTVLAIVMISLMAVMYAAQRSKTSTARGIEATQAARAAVDMMARDLRSAGYAADRDWVASPQQPIAYVDSLQVLINANLSPYPDIAVTGPQYPQAYQPAGNPKPFPLNGTAWQPPIKYRSGAEVIRWTLDVNNDGVVNANDIADVNGVDARRTPNPDDYVLVRQVYGDSAGNVAGNNGGQMERVALVRAPGGGVPPMFTVQMRGGQTWDWAAGPVPPSRIQDIERITIQVVAPSNRPDSKGKYPQTTLRTEVGSMRNVPDLGQTEYALDGWVYNDQNRNRQKDAGEPGLAGSVALLGGFSTTTDATGHFFFLVRAGTYTLRHAPPIGYGNFTSPDSYVVVVPPAAQHSFADTARAGGPVVATVFEDRNDNAIRDAGEPALGGVQVTVTPANLSGYTDATGTVNLFADPGAYTVTATPPDSMAASTANPVSGVMTNGGSASVTFGMSRSGRGHITGRVYLDNNLNGVIDNGENGIPNVWVGISPDFGLTVLAYQYTDNLGNYDLQVPTNNPPGTRPYYAIVIVPTGAYPTTSTAIGPLLVALNQYLNNNNFGMRGYQVIPLNASRVLSLVSGDLIEGDWSGGNTQDAVKDADLVLGNDVGGTDNISVWFNQYKATNLFVAAPSYTRTAAQSVLAMALDTLDSTPDKARPDLVTGTRSSAAGNFFAWFNQNSKNNEGYLPSNASRSMRTTDNGDVQTVLTGDLIGGNQPDILVGTKSPTAGLGSIETWQNGNAATPTFTRAEVYPPSGGMAVNSLGEVTAMALADLDKDGLKDLVVATSTGATGGQLLLLHSNGKTSGSSRFTLQGSYSLTAPVTALTVARVDFDTLLDVVIGIQTAADQGKLQCWLNTSVAGSLSMTLSQVVDAPGLVTALASGDMGGLSSRTDLVMGWRATTTSFVGGLRVFYLDSGAIPSSGTDPSGGSVTNWVPTLTINNFNYGVKPPADPPYLTDFAAGIKSSSTTGAVIVFVR